MKSQRPTKPRQMIQVGNHQITLPEGVTVTDWALERVHWQNPRIRAFLGCIRLLEGVFESNYSLLHCSPERLLDIWGKVRQVSDLITHRIAPLLRSRSRIPSLEEARQSAEISLGLLHGQLPAREKQAVMAEFRSGDLQVLVATTVIEVGVDVANATVMVIEHADRFGLAQLHQLRGRIGRGSEKSLCILVAPKNFTGEGRERLETMARTSNGFEIAEVDLKLRGPGEFFGTRQHGDLGFHIANPLRDRELLELARREAFALVDNPTARVELEKLLEELGPLWRRRYQLAHVG